MLVGIDDVSLDNFPHHGDRRCSGKRYFFHQDDEFGHALSHDGVLISISSLG